MHWLPARASSVRNLIPCSHNRFKRTKIFLISQKAVLASTPSTSDPVSRRFFDEHRKSKYPHRHRPQCEAAGVAGGDCRVSSRGTAGARRRAGGAAERQRVTSPRDQAELLYDFRRG